MMGGSLPSGTGYINAVLLSLSSPWKSFCNDVRCLSEIFDWSMIEFQFRKAALLFQMFFVLSGQS